MRKGMSVPPLGDFRHRIKIGQTLSMTNENGFPSETDTVLCEAWTAVEDDASRWFHTADADNAERGLAFIIRWWPGIKPGMWVLWNGEKHTITKIGEYDFKHTFMRLTASAVKGVK